MTFPTTGPAARADTWTQANSLEKQENPAGNRRVICGANGIRTRDPHTASVVRYQLRHSP